MNQNSVKAIGISDESRNNASISYINQVKGLKDILNMDFEEWSNFDRWESIGAQQWIFVKALDIFRGNKIDIRCDCCEHIDFLNCKFNSMKNQKCYGIKTAYMIEKVVNEIELAKERRESDGTYFS